MTVLLDLNSLYDLSGRVAIVTGAAEGMGKETCRYLASAGATVVVADINLPWAENTAAEIVTAGGMARAYLVDLAVEKSVVDLIRAVRKDLGRLDILVNVAGLQDRELLEETSLELWDKLHHVNLRGSFLTLREAAKVMKVDGNGGRIVNIASMGAVHPVFEGLVAYNASKSGVLGLTRNAAYELAAHGITVNALLPGNVTTEGQARSPGPPIDMEKIKHMTPPLGRTGRTSDIASAILFLVSPASQWMTGQTLVVDGGHLNK